MRIETRIEIDRSPAEVYALATDPGRFPLWQRDVRRVEVHGGGRFTTVRRIAGVDQRMLQEVVRDEAPRAWAARAISGAVRPVASIAVEPLDGGARCAVTFGLEFDGGGPLGALVRRLAGRAAPRSYARLKALLEAGPNQVDSASVRPSPPDQAT